jgi:uncharacterized protein
MAQKVEIVQDTAFPFGEEINFKINARDTIRFPLSFRIPSWGDTPQVSINGTRVAEPPIKSGFLTLDRPFRPGDSVKLALPMKPRVTFWPQHGIGVEHGPLVYSLPIEERWSSVVEPTYTNAEFPSWSATPVNSWNYGLAVNPERIDGEIVL